MKPCHFCIDKSKPDFETDKGKWWLCEKGKKYVIWRFDSKENEYKEFLIQRKADNAIVDGDYTISGVGEKFSILGNLSE